MSLTSHLSGDAKLETLSAASSSLAKGDWEKALRALDGWGAQDSLSPPGDTDSLLSKLGLWEAFSSALHLFRDNPHWAEFEAAVLSRADFTSDWAAFLVSAQGPPTYHSGGWPLMIAALEGHPKKADFAKRCAMHATAFWRNERWADLPPEAFVFSAEEKKEALRKWAATHEDAESDEDALDELTAARRSFSEIDRRELIDKADVPAELSSILSVDNAGQSQAGAVFCVFIECLGPGGSACEDWPEWKDRAEIERDSAAYPLIWDEGLARMLAFEEAAQLSAAIRERSFEESDQTRADAFSKNPKSTLRSAPRL